MKKFFDKMMEELTKDVSEENQENIDNRTPEKWGELIKILKKEHEETFKDITLEAQLDKFVDEYEEYMEADNPLDEARELADMMVVAAGVARFAPRFVKKYLIPTIVDDIKDSDEYGNGLITQLALEKSIINKNRDWSKKGGKYQHK